MERCGFFDADMFINEEGEEQFDRVYLAAQFAAYFASFIGNGVFGGKSNELQVITAPTPQMQVVVYGGQGYINGYWYENTDALALPLELADGVLNRIDSIVLRWGSSERTMWLAVKKGVPSSNPMPPPVQRSADYFELQLATVSVKAGTISISKSMITDTRLDTSVCGFVVGLIKQFDTTAFGIQLQTFINEYIARTEAEYDEYMLTIEELEQMARDAYQTFLDLLEQLQGQGSNALQDFLQWLLNQRVPAEDALGEFVAWLTQLRDMSTSQVQELLEQLEGLIDENVAAALDARIRTLEDLEPTVQIADITHDFNRYMKVNLYRYDYGVGVQGAGLGPAGGTVLDSVNCSYTLDELNEVIVRTQKGFTDVEAVNKLSETMYVVVFTGILTSILIVLS